jgi:hypothetical protein
MQPNLFAYLALISWPVVASIIYRLKPLVSATLWTILAGQLLLPAGTFFKFQMVPQFDKNSIPSLCALIGCAVAAGRPLRLWTKFRTTEAVLCVYLGSPVITSVLNGDPLEVGGTVLPGVGIYDGMSALLSQFIVLIPFFLGRQFLRNIEDIHQILRILVLAGVAYSILLLFEIRFSPQLHFWIYGYYPSDFIQEMREGGGFRPMVFMGHGLIASFFAMTATVSAAALWRIRSRILGVTASGVALYLGLVLYLCKSGAALIYGLVLTPLVRWAPPKLQAWISILFVSLALLYPLLRIAEIFPTQTIVNVAMAVNEPRASSLEFRFNQEEELLQHAVQRTWFGWGRYGRNRVYKENWQGVGVDTSITDGRWIITFGQFGIVGFLAEFGLLGISVFRAAGAIRLPIALREALLLATLALIVSVNIVELLPNSTLGPWTWLLVGALLGNSEAIRVRARKQRREINAGVRKTPAPYTGAYPGSQRQ